MNPFVVQKTQRRNYSFDVKKVCGGFCEYFNITRNALWQNGYI